MWKRRYLPRQRDLDKIARKKEKRCPICKRSPMTKLKLCPFCKGKAQSAGGAGCHYVFCNKCCAQTDYGYETEQQAIAAWNKRKK